MTDEQKELLIKSLDQPLDIDEQRRLDQALESEPELMQLKHQLEVMRNTLGQLDNLQFSDSFSDQLMQKIDLQVDTIYDFFLLSFKRVAIAAAALIVLSIGINWMDSGEINLTIDSNTEQTIEDDIDISLADLF